METSATSITKEYSFFKSILILTVCSDNLTVLLTLSRL